MVYLVGSVGRFLILVNNGHLSAVPPKVAVKQTTIYGSKQVGRLEPQVDSI